MKEKKPFIGLIGLGYWGQNLLRNFNELGVLRAACDSNKRIVADKEKLFPKIKFFHSLKDLLDDPSIEAVAISTPAATHYELAKKALLAGKDVLVEKPLSLTVKQGSELIDIAAEQKKIIMVGHILQYHPAVIKLKEILQAGDLGKIRYIYSNRLNIGKLRTEENILWSFAPHDISVILMLLGEEPVRINAFGGDYINAGINDTTLTTLEFTNGVKGHVFVSWLHPFKEQKLIVVGSKAMVVFDDLSKEKLFFYPHKIVWRNGKIPVAQKADFQVIPCPQDEPLKLELQHFIDCVKNRQAPKTDGQEGLRILKVLEAAENALLSSRQTETKDYFIHPSSYVDFGVKIGEGTKIWNFSHILKNSHIGKKCIIGQNASIGPDVIIGDRCKIQNNVSIYKGVTLEDEVFCGPSCVFTNVYNPRAFIERKEEFRPTLVKRGASIGANATIVCGATIGRYAFVGAGAVVKDDVPDYAVVVGVPAKQKDWICKCGLTLRAYSKNGQVKCGSCGSVYKIKKGKFIALAKDV